MSIIPFNDNHSYVIRSLPIKSDQRRNRDDLGRTKEDCLFLKQFETIFLAASNGDLDKCQKIVNAGYCDFNAFSVGRYTTVSGKSLDQISPLEIAKRYGHQKIIDFFKSKMNQGPKRIPQRNPDLSTRVALGITKKLQDSYSSDVENEYSKQLTKSQCFSQLSELDKKIFESSMFAYSCLSTTDLNAFTYAAITSPYTNGDLQADLVKKLKLKDTADKIEALKKLIEQPFKGNYNHRKRVEILALVEFLEMNEDLR